MSIRIRTVMGWLFVAAGTLSAAVNCSSDAEQQTDGAGDNFN